MNLPKIDNIYSLAAVWVTATAAVRLYAIHKATKP